MVEEDHLNHLQSNPSILYVLAATKYSWNWRVNASGSRHIQPCCYSSYHPLQPPAFAWLQCKWPAFIGWQMQVIQLEYSMLYLDQTGWNQHSELAISTIQLCWHVLFEIKLVQSSSAIQPKWLMYQHLKISSDVIPLYNSIQKSQLWFKNLTVSRSLHWLVG